MKLIVVDDNKAVRTALKLVLADTFDEVVAVGDPHLLPALLLPGNVDAVLLDMNFDNQRLDGGDGLFWLACVKDVPHAPAVVMITAFGDVPLAVEAMKRGAEDFVTKPWDNDELKDKLLRAIDNNRRKKNLAKSLSNAAEIEQRESERSRMTLDELKIEHVKSVIYRCGGNLSVAAAQLGVNRQTLYNILKKQ